MGFLWQSEMSGMARMLFRVPQNIHLLDDSVYANVAFGLEEDQIDFDKVWDALEAAQLLEFVDDLPFGIHTQLVNNGINLSGGQRQRLL